METKKVENEKEEVIEWLINYRGLTLGKAKEIYEEAKELAKAGKLKGGE